MGSTNNVSPKVRTQAVVSLAAPTPLTVATVAHSKASRCRDWLLCVSRLGGIKQKGKPYSERLTPP